jgi:hypothetical protein
VTQAAAFPDQCSISGNRACQRVHASVHPCTADIAAFAVLTGVRTGAAASGYGRGAGGTDGAHSRLARGALMLRCFLPILLPLPMAAVYLRMGGPGMGLTRIVAHDAFLFSGTDAPGRSAMDRAGPRRAARVRTRMPHPQATIMPHGRSSHRAKPRATSPHGLAGGLLDMALDERTSCASATSPMDSPNRRK